MYKLFFLFIFLWVTNNNSYSSRRLGVKEYLKNQVGFEWDSTLGCITNTTRIWGQTPWYSLEYQEVITADSTNLYGNSYASHIIGLQQY